MSVASSTNYNATSCTGTQTVSKGDQAAPVAPTLSSATTTSIVLNTCSGGGCEYSRDSGSWQSSTTFSGLTSSTSYSFTQRKAETTNYNASSASSAASLTTESALLVIGGVIQEGVCAGVSLPITRTDCGGGLSNLSYGGSVSSQSCTSGSSTLWANGSSCGRNTDSGTTITRTFASNTYITGINLGQSGNSNGLSYMQHFGYCDGSWVALTGNYNKDNLPKHYIVNRWCTIVEQRKTGGGWHSLSAIFVY